MFFNVNQDTDATSSSFKSHQKYRFCYEDQIEYRILCIGDAQKVTIVSHTFDENVNKTSIKNSMLHWWFILTHNLFHSISKDSYGYLIITSYITWGSSSSGWVECWWIRSFLRFLFFFDSDVLLASSSSFENAWESNPIWWVVVVPYTFVFFADGSCSLLKTSNSTVSPSLFLQQ